MDNIDATIKAMNKRGASDAEIGREVGLDRRKIRERRVKMGLSANTTFGRKANLNAVTTIRACNRCGHNFESEKAGGAWLRTCKTCKSNEPFVAADTVIHV